MQSSQLAERIASSPGIHIDLFCTPQGLKRAHLSLASSFTCSFHGDYFREEILRWLNSYAQKKPGVIDFPFDDEDLTEFQKKAHPLLRAIPFGKTKSYGEIATELGGVHLSRAVGSACGKNPWPLFVGCHRVIAASGALGGFGYGPDFKLLMLNFES